MSILRKVGRLNASEDEWKEHRSLSAFHSVTSLRPSAPHVQGPSVRQIFRLHHRRVSLRQPHQTLDYCYRRLKYVNWDPYGLLLQLCSPLTVYIWNRSINFSFKSSPALRPQASSSVKLGNEPLPPSGPVLSFLMRDPTRIALILKSFLPRIRSSWKNTDTFSHIRGMHAFFMTPAQLRWIKLTLDGTQLFWCADG